MENPTSTAVGSTFQKSDLDKLSFEKGAINLNVWDGPCSEYKLNGCDVAGVAEFLHPCNYCTVDAASIRDDDMQNGLVCTQCRDKEKSGGSLCKLNRQATGEVAWVPKRRAQQTIHQKNMFLVNVPPCSQTSPDIQMKQHRSLIGFLQEPHRDLRHRIMLPPKKRICMNMELSAAQPRDRTLRLAEEVCMASKHADPPTFSMGNIDCDVKHNVQGGAQKIVKPVDTTSGSCMSMDTDGSTKDMKSSKLLLRRYKLLSEIV
ncbi:hypothetical protein O6H91_05G024500 [Diphasiastrum complanatum]|uniref:Uncharacterized protein n=1 Tax=Diphasiastrum complanatum TaxID=34168 RepID=A0ACC2DLF3_DIPCM|nr:hypothetical protein O6H91_05G024500 [Diphasiastrum complanatum]